MVIHRLTEPVEMQNARPLDLHIRLLFDHRICFLYHYLKELEWMLFVKVLEQPDVMLVKYNITFLEAYAELDYWDSALTDCSLVKFSILGVIFCNL